MTNYLTDSVWTMDLDKDGEPSSADKGKVEAVAKKIEEFGKLVSDLKGCHVRVRILFEVEVL